MKKEKKKTFTYASTETAVEKAKKIAFEEGTTVSEKLDLCITYAKVMFPMLSKLANKSK